jgi:hypothetical protein
MHNETEAERIQTIKDDAETYNNRFNIAKVFKQTYHLPLDGEVSALVNTLAFSDLITETTTTFDINLGKAKALVIPKVLPEEEYQLLIPALKGIQENYCRTVKTWQDTVRISFLRSMYRSHPVTLLDYTNDSLTISKDH